MILISGTRNLDKNQLINLNQYFRENFSGSYNAIWCSLNLIEMILLSGFKTLCSHPLHRLDSLL